MRIILLCTVLISHLSYAFELQVKEQMRGFKILVEDKAISMTGPGLNITILAKKCNELLVAGLREEFLAVDRMGLQYLETKGFAITYSLNGKVFSESATSTRGYYLLGLPDKFLAKKMASDKLCQAK